MSVAFDSLGFVRTLESSGVERAVAEAHADAAAHFLLKGVATADDVDDAVERMEHDLKGAVDRLGHEIVAAEQRMTIRLGGLIVIAVGAIVALERLLQ